MMDRLHEEERQRLNWLCGFLTSERLARLQEVLAERTRHLTVVLDDVHQEHNVSAVLRSCEALGIQDVHLIEIRNSLELNAEIALGAQKWLTVKRYGGPDCVSECIGGLKENGYRIVVTSPHADAHTPATLPIEQRVAIVIGNEAGVRKAIAQQADEFLRIEMYGFTESFNLSVAAALCLAPLRERLQQSDLDWGLSGVEQERLLFEWVRASVPHLQALERRYVEEQAAADDPPALES